MPIDVDSARLFIYGNGRLLEQHTYGVLFENGDPQSVVRALAGYQNADGGFGHGLEPDKCCPHSQPLDVEIALEYLLTVDAEPPADFLRAFDFLANVTDSEGAVPVLLPTIADYPRAPHWAESNEYPPDLNPTASIAGYGHALGVRHAWIDDATAYAFSTLEDDKLPNSTHALLCATRFLEHVPDRERAARLTERVAAALPESSYFHAHPDPNSYGLGPLNFSPTPTSLAHPWFDRELLEEHLGHLERQQQPDGGWVIQWEPPSPASRCQWRAMRTLQALTTLTAYGRIET